MELGQGAINAVIGSKATSFSGGSTKAERALMAARLFQRKRLEFEALERVIAEVEKRVKVSGAVNYQHNAIGLLVNRSYSLKIVHS